MNDNVSQQAYGDCVESDDVYLFIQVENEPDVV
jgi:hypothetical protein